MKKEATTKTNVNKKTIIILYILSVGVVFMFYQKISDGSGALSNIIVSVSILQQKRDLRIR